MNIRSGERGSPLENAIHSLHGAGSSDCALELIERGADVNITSAYWGTPLAAAASIGDEKMVQALLDKGADVNRQGGKYGNPLQTAIWQDFYGVAHLLLDRGADIHAEGITATALVTACGYAAPGQLELVERLLGLGADIEAHGVDNTDSVWGNNSTLPMAAYWVTRDSCGCFWSVAQRSTPAGHGLEHRYKQQQSRITRK
jgi:ankyrin repeat protein